MKVVCDTNVFISAIIYGGNPERIILAAQNDVMTIVASPAILLEVSRVLHTKFLWQEYQIREVIAFLGKLCTVIKPSARVHRIKTDPSDNHVLACAIAADADYIISGDKRHLLPIKKFRGVSIVSPATFIGSLL